MERRLIDRRNLLKLMGIGSLTLAIAPEAIGAEVDISISPDGPEAALSRLMAGNERFVKQKTLHPHQSLERVRRIAPAQKPFATILSCADSRVVSEIIFDQGLGDLFDIRIAGNVVTPEVVGSVEYASANLSTPLVLVLGHKRCGVITAAVEGGNSIGEISKLVADVQPAIEVAKLQPGNLIDNAIAANVQYQKEKLRLASKTLQELIYANKLKLVGGIYDLDTGAVSLLS
jgi:carbonic anhydrase